MSRTAALRIAVVAACPMPQPRGTPVRILRLSEAIAARGHEVHLVTYHVGDGPLPPELQVHRIPSLPTYRKRTPGPSLQKLLVVDPLLAATVNGVLRRERFDVIHAHHYEGLLTSRLAAAGSGIPIVYDTHTLLASELPGYPLYLPRRWARAVGRTLDRWLPRTADQVVAVTERIGRKLVESGVPADRVTVASQGVEDEFFRNDAPTGAGPPGGRQGRLVYAGNLAPYQGIPLLLESLRRVRARRPDVRLRILSPSSFRPYQALAGRLEVRDAIELSWVGVEELPRALRAADIALNPRVDCDGIPIKLLNYMATGRPIVSFAGSAPILRHGRTALLVEDGDTAGFAEAVVSLLDDPARAARLGEEARMEAERHHRWDAIARQVERVYCKAITGRSRRAGGGASRGRGLGSVARARVDGR